MISFIVHLFELQEKTPDYNKKKNPCGYPESEKQNPCGSSSPCKVSGKHHEEDAKKEEKNQRTKN
jgi:hypothetical protein